MNKVIHPSFKGLVIELFGFLLLVDTFTLVAMYGGIQDTKSFLISGGLISLIYMLFLVFVLLDFILRFMRPVGDYRFQILTYLAEKRYRRTINNYFGSLITFAMMLFYIIYASVHHSPFYFTTAQFFFFAFVGKIYLMSIVFGKREEKEDKGFLITSILTFFLGGSMETITLITLKTQHGIARHPYFVYFLALYSFIKLISAIVSYSSSMKEKDSLLVSFGMLSMASAFYSMFILAITIPATFANDENPTRFAIVGITLAGLMMLMSVLSFIHYFKTRKKL